MLNQKQMIYQWKNCLNTIKPYPKECRLCLLHCPHEALSANKDISLDKCTECGVCMSVCPSEGFMDKDMDNLGEYIFNSQSIILNCPVAQPHGHEISCLGMLDKDSWTTLMMLAGNKEVKIYTGDCGTCEDRKACAVSVGFFKEIHEAWPAHPQVKIEIAPPSDDDKDPAPKKPPSSGLNRNISLRERGKKRIKELFPDIDEETYTIPKTRKWLLEALKANQDLKISYKSIKVNDNCTGCGVCSKICPQGALQQTEKDGKIRLIYEPEKCIQCGRCVDICGPKAMKLEYVDLSYRYITGKILVCETEAKFCCKCNKQIYHKNEPSLCMACASKDPSLKGILY